MFSKVLFLAYFGNINVVLNMKAILDTLLLLALLLHNNARN